MNYKSQSKSRNIFSVAIAIIVISSLLLLSACEKNITVDLPASKSEVVVEGYVETGTPPYVYLSYSTDYFAAIDSASLINYTIKGATVTISDGIITDTLLEISPSYGYFYVSTKLTGTVGRTYTLTVKTTNGEIVTAQTTLHQPVPLDSLWFKTQPNNDTLGFTWARMTDPDTSGNNYRWFAKRLHKDSLFIAPFGSSFEDKFINGTTFDFAFNRGELPNSSSDPNDITTGFYSVGDTVVVKFCTMDNNSYTFWRDAETQSTNNGNPFGSISPITSGVKGGLGIFCAYGASYDTVICKK
ncbi:MAG: DUF4249 domain-containing protein [Bacteroidia bacterium]